LGTLQAADTFRITGTECMGPGVRRDDSIRYLVSAGSGFTLSSGIPAMHGDRHCEERSDEAIQSFFVAAFWIASLRSQ
jgi:hypothetical protein